MRIITIKINMLKDPRAWLEIIIWILRIDPSFNRMQVHDELSVKEILLQREKMKLIPVLIQSTINHHLNDVYVGIYDLSDRMFDLLV